MTSVPNAQLTHIGFYARDVAAIVAFYQRYLGLIVTDSGEKAGQAWAFMSRNPNEHHQVVVASGRGQGQETTINQISFRVDNLADLQRYYALLKEAEVVDLEAVTHGNAWSIYFKDPEQNRIELYAVSPWYVNQPMRTPIDLTASEADILAVTQALIQDNASLQPMEEWADNMRARLSQ
jgi:catechol 2,3-dioxygenase-like lactoylglutathione lyase family enzyme